MRLCATIDVSKFETVRARFAAGGRRPGVSHAFTITEVLVTMILLAMLVIAAISAVTMLDRSSRRQATYTTALEVAQGKLDELLATEYNPPKSPFTAANFTQRQAVTLSVNRNGSAVNCQALVTTSLQAVLDGHVATVVVSYTNYNQPASVQLQTLINKLSGGQP